MVSQPPAWAVNRKGFAQPVFDELRAVITANAFGSELFSWLAEKGVKTLCMELESPRQNGYMESFEACFREECLNREQRSTLAEA